MKLSLLLESDDIQSLSKQYGISSDDLWSIRKKVDTQYELKWVLGAVEKGQVDPSNKHDMYDLYEALRFYNQNKKDPNFGPQVKRILGDRDSYGLNALSYQDLVKLMRSIGKGTIVNPRKSVYGDDDAVQLSNFKITDSKTIVTFGELGKIVVGFKMYLSNGGYLFRTKDRAKGPGSWSYTGPSKPVIDAATGEVTKDKHGQPQIKAGDKISYGKDTQFEREFGGTKLYYDAVKIYKRLNDEVLMNRKRSQEMRSEKLAAKANRSATKSSKDLSRYDVDVANEKSIQGEREANRERVEKARLAFLRDTDKSV